MGVDVRRAKIIVISVLSAALIISALFYVQAEYNLFIPPKMVNLTFEEVGLPQNSTWGIKIYSNAYQNPNVASFTSYNTSSASLTVRTPNTRPYYFTYSPGGYQAMQTSVILPHFNHKTEIVQIDFQKLYSVSFYEKGLPDNYNWSISVQFPNNNYLPNPRVLTTNTSHQRISLVNGTYSYSAGLFDSVVVNNTTYYATYETELNLQGEAAFNLSGENMSIPIIYTTQCYKISVSETGFPSDRFSWNVTMLGETLSSNPNFLGGYYTDYFYVGNGTYQYQAEGATGYGSPNSNGSITVFGANATLVIEYDRVIQS